jgi:hypothetical protein
MVIARNSALAFSQNAELDEPQIPPSRRIWRRQLGGRTAPVRRLGARLYGSSGQHLLRYSATYSRVLICSARLDSYAG